MKITSTVKEIKSGQLPGFAYMFKRIWGYAGKYSEEYGISRLFLFLDYFRCAIMYGCTGNDYFLFKFFKLKRRGKRKFVTDRYEKAFEDAHTDAVQNGITEHKEKSLALFANYMKRDWCGTVLNNDEKQYREFCEKHNRGIVKPVFGVGGHGIEIINIRERFGSGKELREYFLKNGLLIEELITQHEELNRIFPNAINTARIITLKGKVIGAALRMGVGESNVDNAHEGGIFAEIDINEGVIVGAAMRYTNERFVRHPSTGTIIPGFVIPYWNECKAMVEEASKLIPDVYLLGWDIAVTPDGPTLVEVNTHPGLTAVQAPNGYGLKAEFEKINN